MSDKNSARDIYNKYGRKHVTKVKIRFIINIENICRYNRYIKKDLEDILKMSYVFLNIFIKDLYLMLKIYIDIRIQKISQRYLKNILFVKYF